MGIFDPDASVGFETVRASAGTSVFHGHTIPDNYVRIDLGSVVKSDLPLMMPNEAADQLKLSDAAGSSVL